MPPRHPRTRAVLLDALGTLVELEPPWTHLAAGLGHRGRRRCRRRCARRWPTTASTPTRGPTSASLAELRARCAAILARELGPRGRRRDDDGRDPLPRLPRRRAGARRPARAAACALVCVSNWDVSLTEVLERSGSRDCLDGVVTSAGGRCAQARPGDLRARARARRLHAGEALHVGDTPAEDVAGAQAAGHPRAADRPRRRRRHRLADRDRASICARDRARATDRKRAAARRHRRRRRLRPTRRRSETEKGPRRRRAATSAS